jgi:sugar lactone lactonase YvrE
MQIANLYSVRKDRALVTTKFSHTAGVAIVATLFAGCAGAGSTPHLSTRLSAASSASRAPMLNMHMYPLGAYGASIPFGSLHAQKDLNGRRPYAVKSGSEIVYVSNLGENAIDVFEQKGKSQKPIATITDGVAYPGGLTTDRKGNLYVVDESAQDGEKTIPGELQMYAPGATSPTNTYTTDIDAPSDVAVAKDGTIYTADFNGEYNGWVAVYPKGNPKREYRLSDFDGGAPLSVAFDKQQNLYVMYDVLENNVTYSFVKKYKPNAKTGTKLKLAFKFGGGIQVDPVGDILVAQQVYPSAILVFPPGKTKPSESITMPDGGEPFNFALNHKGKLLFSSDWTQYNQVLRYAWPSGKYQYVIANGFNNVSGFATMPYEF